MKDEKYESANNVSSFGLESLLWNLPNDIFTKYRFHKYAFGEVAEYMWRNNNKLSFYKEANGIKPLCNFSADVNKYTRFINDLYHFYEYEI